MTKVYCSI
ncbi:hypothetical protein Zm00014a_006940 [Zea mays]|uniref:Uncharacterized protein n=1 Tax=Zea mays TaxID=4577 RepID=A0A3L6DM79_MAIZE|nr:hypothetical protein Zm00014a_006940 [Zea mays]